MKSIRFVMFHSFRNGVDQSTSMIEMAASSIRLSYPESQIFLLSNLPNSETGLPAFIHTDLIDVDCHSLMLNRIREYKAFVDRTSSDGYVVFCDTDMLFVRRFDKLFKDDFDIALTLRKDWNAPINGAFYAVNMTRKDLVSIFFKDFIKAIENLPENQHYWHGDQTALARMLGAPAVDLARPCFARWNDVRIKYLPLWAYNNTPDYKQRRFHVFYPFARILHFKASKKSFMKAYYRLYVTSRLGKFLRYVGRRRTVRICTWGIM